jgi:hypothetical protein
MFSLPFAPDERFALHFKAEVHCPFDFAQGRLSPGRVCPSASVSMNSVGDDYP